MNHIKTRILYFVVLFVFSLSGHSHAVEDRIYTFGVVPQQASEKLALRWIPLAQMLSEKTGLTIEFATASNIPIFEERLAEGVFDFAYMNPYHFTVFGEHPGYVPIARQKDHMIRGIIVVASDGNVDSVETLSGAELAFPAPHAFAATLITRSYLDRTAPDYKATFVKSHDSVYRAVAQGLFAGGGGIIRTLNEVSPDIRDKLDILWMSPGYTGHAFAAHPQLPKQIQDRVKNALLEVELSSEGQMILKNLGMTGLQESAYSDWDDVRELGIGSDVHNKED